jgi:hypothetical protein
VAAIKAIRKSLSDLWFRFYFFASALNPQLEARLRTYHLETPVPMLNSIVADSVRIHNEALHSGFVQIVKYAIPGLIAFVLLWTRFAKS